MKKATEKNNKKHKKKDAEKCHIQIAKKNTGKLQYTADFQMLA